MPDKKLTDSEIVKALECKPKAELVVLCNHLQAENKSIRRKSLLEAASKFAGHSNYHGDTILCELICMAEGKEVGTAKPLDMSEIKAEAYKKFVDKLCEGRVSNDNTVILAKCLLKELVGEDK